MSLFPTKFVADTGLLTVYTSDSQDVVLKVNGTTVLNERYSPADGRITVAGLRSVLEAAIYGDLGTGSQDHAAALVELLVGSTSYKPAGGYLFASRLRNPRDPQGSKTVMAAGDLTAVAQGDTLLTPACYTRISGSTVLVEQVSQVTGDRLQLADGLTLWVDRTQCADRATCLRFLNRYDVPQTMMSPTALDVKPGFQDQTALLLGQAVRYAVEQSDEYTLRSGRIHSEQEYASWYDLITSRRAEVLIGGQWLPILITKTNYTQQRRSAGLNRVEITFKMADPRQGI